MAKSIAQRLAALEKAVAAFIGVRPRKKKASSARKRTKAAKAKSAQGPTARKTAARKATRKRKSGGRAAAMPFPPG
jgi:hypothetical protein